MKKFLLIVVAAGLMFSCQKKENESAPQFQDVSFKALEITPNTGLKSTADWECKDIIPTHAWVVINGEDYYPELFEVEGVLYTQALKLPVLENNAEYCASAFVLYLEGNGTPGYQADPVGDEIVSGTPQPGSDYETYINADYRFDYCFTVDAFAKAELPIEVLCYQNADYSEFGFNWFAITEIVIREQCFFGDFCITNPADYNDSNYGLQSTWPIEVVSFIDAPAIVSLNVFKNTQAGWVEVANSPFTNNSADAAYGVGSPVCIQYPDNLSIDGEEFKVVLNILIQQGTAYEMVEFHTWFFNDDEMIVEAPPVSDGVVDFVLGTCNLSDTDLQLTLPVVLAIGDFYQGGVIFYLDGSGGGLICTVNDLDGGSGIQWYNGDYIVTGASGTAIGTGQANTTTIISEQGAGTYAATVCTDVGAGWFLPSKDELNEMYLNRAAINATAIANGGTSFNTTVLYWSSSESDNLRAWHQNLADGGQYDYYKYWPDKVRAIRAF